MMKKLIILIILSISLNRGYSCEIILPEKILILKNSDHLEVLNKFDKCSKGTLNEVATILNSVEGKITDHQLKEILDSKNLSVIVHPNIIEVYQLKNLTREQLQVPVDHHLTSINPLNEPNSIPLKNSDHIKVQCEGCLFEKNQILNVNISSLSGSLLKLKVIGEFNKRIKAYYVKKFIPAFSEIKKEDLSEDFSEPIPHTELITELETLHFYKTNKPLKAGTLVRKSDLNGINLVRAGSSTEVVIENKFLKIKTSGISRSNGSYGDLVEVLNLQKKKKYLGKVIDINKIIVDL
jgi:flagella basal body P-ring formation protein FlgA